MVRGAGSVAEPAVAVDALVGTGVTDIGGSGAVGRGTLGSAWRAPLGSGRVAPGLDALPGKLDASFCELLIEYHIMHTTTTHTAEAATITSTCAVDRDATGLAAWPHAPSCIVVAGAL